MRGVFRSEPKLLAILRSLNARRFSVRTGTPGNSYRFGCEVSVGQNPNSWQYLRICARGVFRSEPEFLAIFPSLNARCLSVATGTPGDIYRFGCEASFRQNPNSWQYLRICVRGFFRSEPKFLAIFTTLHARCLSVRTKIPGDISQFECEVFVGQNPNPWRCFPV